jgi:hypothetical protein
LPEDDNNEPSGSRGSDTPKWVAIIGAAGSLVTLLGFLGFANIGQLGSALDSALGGDASASAEPSRASVTSEDDEPSVTYRPTRTSTTSPTKTASPDDSATDETPFTAAALLPDDFEDDRGVGYTRVASGVHGCTDASHMSDNVRRELRGYDCDLTVTGNYLKSGDVSVDADVLVSVQVVRFDDTSTAKAVKERIVAGGSWDFGIWCPNRGRGSDACDGYERARTESYVSYDHRYVVHAVALYVNLSSSPSTETATDAAADAAVTEIGPENYTGG